MGNVKLYFCLTSIFLNTQVVCCCSDNKNETGGCWYTYWYVWVALGLFITVLVTIVVVYYKHKWAKRRTRVRRISVVHPQNPPPYGAPSQLPPSYEDALKHRIAIPGYMDTRNSSSRGGTSGRVVMVHEASTPSQQQRIHAMQSRHSVISMPPSYDEHSRHARTSQGPRSTGHAQTSR